jgi:hypothetical protein
VVSSTAAATLRQLVMFVVDKVVDEDRQLLVHPSSIASSSLESETETETETETSTESPSPLSTHPTTLPDNTQADLHPSALDAYFVFSDLCLLANAEKPHFLKLEYLHKTFALELIESVLTNYHELFRKVCSATLLPSSLGTRTLICNIIVAL